jgi:hypothetical protein
MSNGFCTHIASMFPFSIDWIASLAASNTPIVSRSRALRSSTTSAMAGAL